MSYLAQPGAEPVAQSMEAYKNIKTISLRDPIKEIITDNNIQYQIKTNWHKSGRVPDFILGNYSIDELNKFYEYLGFYEREFISKVEENIFFLISIIKGIIRYSFNTWSLRYNWDEFDLINQKIKEKCDSSLYNTHIINSLLFIGDCREHGYLFSFMFETYLFYLARLMYDRIYRKYELVISYNTFYVNKVQTDDIYTNTTPYDHVLCILKIDGINSLFIDALDVNYDFGNANMGPLYQNLHLHYNDMDFRKDPTNIKETMYILNKAQWVDKEILFKVVPFIDSILTKTKTKSEVTYATNKYLCFEIKSDFFELFINEIRSIVQERRIRVKDTIGDIGRFYDSIKQMTLLYFIQMQLQASINYKKLTPTFVSDCKNVLDRIMRKTSINKKNYTGGNKPSSKKIKKTASKSVKKSIRPKKRRPTKRRRPTKKRTPTKRR